MLRLRLRSPSMIDVEAEANPVPKTLRDCFQDLRDPRVVGRSIHKLYDILAIVLAATIAGCDDFVAMADYARAKERWLRDRMGLELVGGIPSHDTLLRTMAAIRPDQFQECFGRFVDLMVRLSPALKDKHIAIDGKAMRGSKKKLDAAHRMVHMVGAWSTEAGLALGQVKAEEKSNEITAIPKLLEVLDISGALVTIDAAGCQKEIAAKIVAAKGDYLLQVKGNQERLHDDVQALAVAALESDAGELNQTEDAPGTKTHGRTESRYCVVIDDPELLKSAIRDFDLWKGLKSVVVTTCVREVEGKTSSETRYHISSRKATAAEFLKWGRRHWSIENECHWILDVAFREDDHRLQEGHAAANLSMVRRMALSMLKKVTVKLGVKNKRLKASYDNTFAEQVFAAFSD